MSGKIAAIIPYYQEQPGILRDAVISAIAQEGVSDLEIIVVDDGSPVPARDELQDLDLAPHVTLKLIEQSNRGPGAARNRGLDNVSPNTIYNAFLDSDDRWGKSHLRNAQLLLQAGFDMYFADYWLSECQTSLFALGRYGPFEQSDEETEPHISHLQRTDRLALIQGRLRVHTSTIVYRRQELTNLRFPESFWVGEDLAFLLQASTVTDKVGFSVTIDAFSVPGTNIYKKSGWDTPEAIWVLLETAKSNRWIGSHIPMTGDERQANVEKFEQIRRHFVLNALHELRNGQAFQHRNIVRFLMFDPMSLVSFCSAAYAAIYQKIRSA